MALLYHIVADLEKIRSDITSYGMADFPDQMGEAEDILNRSLDRRWYRPNAADRGLDWEETPFDSSLVTADVVKRAACYKSLELIYLLLAKVKKDGDGFRTESDDFKSRYADELNEVISFGVSYDWDESGDIGTDEGYVTGERRLYRR